MLTFDLLEPVADGGEEVVVGRQDGAIHIEFNHRLRAVDRGQLALYLRQLSAHLPLHVVETRENGPDLVRPVDLDGVIQSARGYTLEDADDVIQWTADRPAGEEGD